MHVQVGFPFPNALIITLFSAVSGIATTVIVVSHSLAREPLPSAVAWYGGTLSVVRREVVQELDGECEVKVGEKCFKGKLISRG